jgi:rhodanese-related sulfurtransferase
MGRRTSVGALLAAARDGVPRLTPQEALAAAGDCGLIVDVRSADEQARQGALVRGALHHPLSVVLWRLDPEVPTSNPKLPLETRLILICREGYCSSLAAAQLREIGFAQATDVIGGIDAWLAASLPIEPTEPA